MSASCIGRMPLLVVATGFAACALPACAANEREAVFAERFGSSCVSIDDCDAFLRKLKAERHECEVGPRPDNCEQRERHFQIVRRHLNSRRRLAFKDAEADAVTAVKQERDEAKSALETEHAQLAVIAAQKANDAWAAIDPKQCALYGDDATCYALLRFINDHPTAPQRSEAQNALDAGQIVMKLPPDERPTAPSSEGAPPTEAAEGAPKKASQASPKQAPSPGKSSPLDARR